MQKSISRRALLLSGTFAGIGAIASGAASPKLVSDANDSGGSGPGGAFTLTDGAERSLVAIPPSDPRFEEMVNKHFPALIGDQTFETLKGVCFVLHNKQGPAIHAHELRWTFTLASGPFSTNLSSFWRSRLAIARPVNSCPRTAAWKVLNEGAAALVSPFFTLTSGKSPRQQSVDWNKVISRGALQQFLSQSLPQIKQTSITIASAVYDDYTVLDTDNGRFARGLKKQRNTEIQLAKAVLKKLNDGTPDPHLLGAFNRTYNSPRYFGKRKQEIFHAARKNHARYLHDVLLQKGRDKLLKLVSKQAQQPLTRFQRLNASI